MCLDLCIDFLAAHLAHRPADHCLRVGPENFSRIGICEGITLVLVDVRDHGGNIIGDGTHAALAQGQCLFGADAGGDIAAGIYDLRHITRSGISYQAGQCLDPNIVAICVAGAIDDG